MSQAQPTILNLRLAFFPLADAEGAAAPATAAMTAHLSSICLPGFTALVIPLGIPDWGLDAGVVAEVASRLFKVTSEEMDVVLARHEEWKQRNDREALLFPVEGGRKRRWRLVEIPHALPKERQQPQKRQHQRRQPQRQQQQQ